MLKIKYFTNLMFCYIYYPKSYSQWLKNKKNQKKTQKKNSGLNLDVSTQI